MNHTIDPRLVEALRERCDVLRFELSEDPRFEEYEQVRLLLERYTLYPPDHKSPKPVAAPMPAAPLDLPAGAAEHLGETGASTVEAAPRHVTDTGMRAICDAAAVFLREKKSRAVSSEIHAALVKRGLMESGTRDRGRVTSYLGRSKKIFDNVRGEGYGLVEWSRRS